MKQLHYLAFCPNITAKRYKEIKNLCPNIQNIASITSSDATKAGWNKKGLKNFLAWQETFSPDRADKQLSRLGAKIISMDDSNYPPLLKQIFDPPAFLFIQGSLPQQGIHIAVVGPRKHSQYGTYVTRQLISGLRGHNIVIVSGMAIGIDRVAHKVALDAGLDTLAVLGTGLEQSYPHIGQQILNHGAIITELPPGTHGSKFTFPQRNRIIAGMCVGSLIIEAGESSGALVTAQCALDNNRDVFAVPQNVTSVTSLGVNKLLRQGAHLVADAEDILSVLQIKNSNVNRDNNPGTQKLSDTESAIMASITAEPIHIDHIICTTRLPSTIVCTTVTLMEMRGLVKNVGGMTYTLV